MLFHNIFQNQTGIFFIQPCVDYGVEFSEAGFSAHVTTERDCETD